MSYGRPETWGVAIAGCLIGLLLTRTDLARHIGAPTVLTRIQASGELRVAVPPDWTPAGVGAQALEWALVSGFAQELGVAVEFQQARSLADLTERVASGRADLGMPGATLPPPRRKGLRQGPVYRRVHPVVFCPDRPPPRAADGLRDVRLYAPEQADTAALRAALERRAPGVRWREHPAGPQELVERARAKDGCALLAGAELAALRTANPQLPAGLPVGNPLPAAWLLRAREDSSLEAAVAAYFGAQQAAGELSRLAERHEGPAADFTPEDYRAFRAATAARLPRYEGLFRAAARRHDLDWRLLAALAYQESRWNPRAVSPTGVRGLMMLAKPTARELGVRDRQEVAASIEAGARYLAYLRRTVAPHAPEPDRTWFAVAAYNTGPGPVLTARRIAARRGANPNWWAAVKPHLAHALRERPVPGRAAGALVELTRHVDAVRRYHASLADAPPQQVAEAPTGGVY